MQIKLLKYKKQDGYIFVTIYNEKDNTKVSLSVVDGNRDKQEILKDALILSKFTNKEKYEDEEVIENVEMAEPRPSKMYADFTNLSGYVIDQYADKMENEIEYSIEGKGATIQGNKIVEEEVKEDTSYFIVAKCGELEEKRERFLYKKRDEEQENNSLEQRLSDLEIALSTQLGGEINAKMEI